MTEKELRDIFKPDKYGFCRVEINGKIQGFWFDTVCKMVEALNVESD
jgi:hypothetical protein